MRPQIGLTAVLAAAFLASTAGAQSYTLKVRSHPEPGKTITVKETGKINVAVSVSVGGNVVKEDKKVGTDVKEYTEKVLERDEKGLKKFTRTYAKVTKSENGEPKDLSYGGKTIIFERRDGKYVAMAEGGGVDEKDLKELTKSANNSVDEMKLMPAKAVQVGDSWAIPKDVLGSLLGDLKEGADIDKLKVTGKLTKAYKKDSQQWGTVDVTIAVPIVKFGPFTLTKAIPFQAKLTLDLPIDGSSTANQSKGTLAIKGVSEFEQNGQTITIDLTLDGDFRHEQSAEK
jgi:hypothetical protein